MYDITSVHSLLNSKCACVANKIIGPAMTGSVAVQLFDIRWLCDYCVVIVILALTTPLDVEHFYAVLDNSLI